MYLKPFEFKKNNKTYIVECNVTYLPALAFDKHTSASRDDMLHDLTVEDLMVVDCNGNDVSDEVDVPDSVVLRELELQEEQGVDLTDLTIHHISEEACWYRENMMDGFFEDE